MADNCPSPVSVVNYNTNGPGLGGIAENSRATNSADTNLTAAANVRKSQMTHEVLMEEARRIIDLDSPAGVPVSSHEAQQLKVSAGVLARMIEQAGESRARIEDALGRAWSLASGSTIGEQSKWLGLMTGAYKFFANKDAAMERQLLSYCGMQGEHTGDNVIVRAYETMESKTKGRFAEIMTYRKNLSDYVMGNKLLDRSGYELEDLLHGVGYYAVARHMIERNNFLLNIRWPELLRKAVGDAERNGTKDVQKYVEYIQNLRDNLDNPNPPEGLVSGGYTNGQARAMMDDFLRSSRLSRDEAETLADMMVEWNQQITSRRIEEGFVPKEVVEVFPNFQHMVPVKSLYDNTGGPANDAAIYNPGRYYAIEGSATPPESAYASIQHYARRAAVEYGARDFATYGHVIAHMQKHNGRADMGIRSTPYDDLIRMKYHGSPIERHVAESVLDDSYGAGLVADLPVINTDGTYAGSTKRYYIYFDRKYVSDLTGVTGYELQQALTRSAKAAATLEPLATLTGMYGQMFTRFTPFFGPVNLMRDAGERLLHMAGRSWVDDTTGNTVLGSDILTAYLGNLPRAMKISTSAILGRLDNASEMGQLWNEYVGQGLRMQFTPGQEHKQLTFDDIISGSAQGKSSFRKMLEQRDMRGVADALGKLGKYKDTAIGAFDKWNDIYNNAASLAQFMTLREAGLSRTAAGHATLDLLNLRQHGYIAPFLRMMFPFVNVTAQSAASMMRSIGLAPDAKGQFHVNTRGAVSMAVGLGAATMLYEMARDALGTDENGHYVMDSMSVGDLSRFLPVSLGEGTDFLKMQLPLGSMNILSTIAVSLGRVQRGIMKPEDAVFESVAALARNVTPADWPAFSMSQDPAAYFTQALTPTLARPIVDMAINKNFMGQPITHATANSYEPMSAQGSSKTERMYHDLAKQAYEQFGVDLSPEQWKHLHSNVDIGFLRLVRYFTDSPDSMLKVKDPDNPSAKEVLGPFLSALGGSMLYGRVHYMQQSLFYRSVNDLRERIQDEGIKIISKEYGSDADKRVAYQTKVLRQAGWSKDEIDAFFVVDRAQKALRKIDEQVRNDAAPLLIGAESSDGIRRLFAEAGRQKEAIYTEANRLLQ